MTETHLPMFTIVPTPDEAGNVLYFVEGEHAAGARRPGSFTTALIDAMFKADQFNLTGFSVRWPGLVQAVSIYKNVRGGVEILSRLSLGETMAEILDSPGQNPVPADLDPTATES